MPKQMIRLPPDRLACRPPSRCCSAPAARTQAGPPPPPEVSVITLQPRADRHHRPAARAHHRLSRRRSAPAGHGHRAEAPVYRRHRSESGRAAVPDRCRQLSRRFVVGAGRAQARRGAGGHREAARGTLRAADRGQRGFQAGERRSHRRARACRSGRRLGARRRSTPRASTWCTRRCCRPSPGRIGRTHGHRRRAGHQRAGRRRWPPCSSSIPSTSTSRSPAPRCCGCSASSPTASW